MAHSGTEEKTGERLIRLPFRIWIARWRKEKSGQNLKKSAASAPLPRIRRAGHWKSERVGA